MHSRSSGGHFAGLAAWLPQVPPASCSVVNFSLLALLRLCKKLDPFDEFYYYHEIYVFVVSESCSVVSDSLQPHGLYSPWNSPGQNTGVGSLSLLQGIFPNPGIEPRSPAWQAGSLPAEPPGKPICCKVTIKIHLAKHTPALGCLRVADTHSESGSKPVQASSASCALR